MSTASLQHFKSMIRDIHTLTQSLLNIQEQMKIRQHLPIITTTFLQHVKHFCSITWKHIPHNSAASLTLQHFILTSPTIFQSIFHSLPILFHFSSTSPIHGSISKNFYHNQLIWFLYRGAKYFSIFFFLW